MKTTAALLFFIVSFSISAQKFELTGGVLHNTFFDTEEKYGYRMFQEQPAYGYAINLGYEQKIEIFPLRFTLGLENYGGSIKATEIGRMYNSTLDVNVKKTALTIGAYPINLTLINHFNINIGGQFNILIEETVKGEGETVYYGNTPTIVKENKFKGQVINFGLRGRLAYDIDLNDRLAISPQYDFYYGLSNESGDFPYTVRAYRHYLSVGLQMKVVK